MTTLQVLKLDITAFYGTITTIIAIVMFVFWYRREAKKAATMQDIKESEARLTEADKHLSDRISRVEDQLRQDIKEIKDGQRDILNHIINCTKR